MSFRLWALLSALFAGLTAVLAKKGVETVPSNLALAIRVMFVVVFAWGIAIATKQTQIAQLSSRAWLFLGLSGLGTALSWLCYFRALKEGPVSAVAPIDKLSFVIAVVLGVVFMGEKVTWQTAAGAAIIAVGVMVSLLH